MRRLLVFLFFTVSPGLFAQSNQNTEPLDSKYLEDQLYVGISYKFLLDKPEGISQRNLSYGLQGGFIKDLPINAGRNVAIGIGLGYAINSYYSNLFVTETGEGFEYTDEIESGISLKRNKIENHLIEMPIEFRWRNSNATDYKFWRIYTGIKLGYVVGSRSKFVSDTQQFSFYNTDTRNFQYGLVLNFGYNTFNIHAYYALTNLFEDGVVTTEGNPVTFTPLRIGIIFYIL